MPVLLENIWSKFSALAYFENRVCTIKAILSFKVEEWKLEDVTALNYGKRDKTVNFIEGMTIMG